MIQKWQAEKAITVKQGCELLNISRAGYYAALRKRKPQPICPIKVQLKSHFETSGRSYGSRRLVVDLNNQGIRIGRYRVRSLMKEMNIKAIWKRKFVNTTDSNHSLPIFENVLNRKFKPLAANQAWVSDITYIRTRSGWLYLAAVLDLYSRKIVGWAMASTMPAELVCTALQLAICQRQPKPGLVVHSDRGSQYASHEYRDLLNRYDCIGSMSRKGNCWDNAVMERFFLNLKMERVWRQDYANFEEARCNVTDYMINFYNSQRLHSTLGYLSPNNYEAKMITKEPIVVS
jgi:transposase InsO family protein